MPGRGSSKRDGTRHIEARSRCRPSLRRRRSPGVRVALRRLPWVCPSPTGPPQGTCGGVTDGLRAPGLDPDPRGSARAGDVDVSHADIAQPLPDAGTDAAARLLDDDRHARDRVRAARSYRGRGRSRDRRPAARAPSPGSGARRARRRPPRRRARAPRSSSSSAPARRRRCRGPACVGATCAHAVRGARAADDVHRPLAAEAEAVAPLLGDARRARG